MSELTPDEYQAEIRRLRAELAEHRAGRGVHAVPATPPLKQRDILRMLLEERLVRAASLSRATARLTQNAKGETQIEVLAEVSNADASAAVDEAAARARQAYDALRLLYPYGSIVSPTSEGGSQ